MFPKLVLKIQELKGEQIDQSINQSKERNHSKVSTNRKVIEKFKRKPVGVAQR